MVLVAATILGTPLALADCYNVEIGSVGDGLGFLLQPASGSLRFGFETGVPGEGQHAFLEITPSMCDIPGVSVIPGGGSGSDPTMTTASNVRSLIPLP